jgi:hypothetical protein
MKKTFAAVLCAASAILSTVGGHNAMAGYPFGGCAGYSPEECSSGSGQSEDISFAAVYYETDDSGQRAIISYEPIAWTDIIVYPVRKVEVYNPDIGSDPANYCNEVRAGLFTAFQGTALMQSIEFPGQVNATGEIVVEKTGTTSETVEYIYCGE